MSYDEISWWENELTPKERSELMGDYTWHGSAEERHAKLHEMRLAWKKMNCVQTVNQEDKKQ